MQKRSGKLLPEWCVIQPAKTARHCPDNRFDRQGLEKCIRKKASPQLRSTMAGKPSFCIHPAPFQLMWPYHSVINTFAAATSRIADQFQRIKINGKPNPGSISMVLAEPGFSRLAYLEVVMAAKVFIIESLLPDAKSENLLLYETYL